LIRGRIEHPGQQLDEHPRDAKAAREADCSADEFISLNCNLMARGGHRLIFN
jgi:hypothetical protein